MGYHSVSKVTIERDYKEQKIKVHVLDDDTWTTKEFSIEQIDSAIWYAVAQLKSLSM